MLPLLLCLLAPAAGAPPRPPLVMPPAEAPLDAEATARRNRHRRASKLFPDLVRFPDLAVCQARLEYLDKLEAWLEERRALGLDAAHTEAWLEHVRDVKAPWATLRAIRYPFTAASDREAVARLRRLVGEEAWWAGRMPWLDPAYFPGY